MARSGITVLESIIALAVLAVLIGAIVPGFVGFLRVNTQSELRSQAVVAAGSVMDSIRADRAWLAESTDNVDLPDRREVEVSKRIFGVAIEHEPYCEDGTCYDDARRVGLEVEHDGRIYYRVATVFTRLD